MATARAALLRSCGPARTGRFRLLTGTATITPRLPAMPLSA